MFDNKGGDGGQGALVRGDEVVGRGLEAEGVGAAGLGKVVHFVVAGRGGRGC